VRAAVSIALLAGGCLAGGCLAAPPAADLSKDPPLTADASTSDASAVGCVSGSLLDLVFVDRIAVVPAAWNQASLVGLAVFANPGEDTILVAGASATAVSPDPDVLVDAALLGAEEGFMLSPGEAKGALIPPAVPVVGAAFDESWVDTVEPALSAGFTVNWAGTPEEIGAVGVPIQVLAGDYRFDIVVRLDPDGSKEVGAPISAARVTATCP
jgi:hypothetical protein